jgi:glycosyltransferase involved in cell wall biosynthesis
MTDEFFDLSSFGYLVYHCVDEIKAQPGMKASILETAEKRLTTESDIVFTSTRLLADSRRAWNSNTHYFPNVADFDHFSKAMNPETEVPKDLAEFPEPRLGFIGAISSYKLDFQLIREIAINRPEWSIVLIGQVGEGDPWTDITHLQGLPNLHLMGPRPYDQLPAYLKGFNVALLPNKINEYTEAMFPIKFFEYMGAGCPVVSVDLPSIRDYKDMIAVADSSVSFIYAIETILDGNVPPIENRLALANEHTYESRTRQMLALVEEPLSREYGGKMAGDV